jgi:hypothetical protein
MRMEMKSPLLAFATVVCVFLPGLAVATTANTDPDCHLANWGPYNPMPGHPSLKEREEFVRVVGPLAKAAEARYGVPAAALAAMSIDESGYGWTRTALNANNLFGFKYTKTAAKAGFTRYVLPCQPASDVGNAYVIYPSYSEAFDMVAERLATLSYYSAATKKYVATEPKTREAIRAWVKAIALHYNCCPARYIKSITRTINNPLAPSDSEAEDSLFKLSIDSPNL